MSSSPVGPYRPRHVHFVGIWQVDDWRVKIYALSREDALPAPALMATAKSTARTRLALAARDDPQNHGVAILTVHEGQDGDYVLVDWWSDNDILRHHNYGAPKRSAEMMHQWPGPAACVWELAITAFERTAWIKHVLSRQGGPDLAGYLAAHLSGTV